jgi:hypothetical protein
MRRAQALGFDISPQQGGGAAGSIAGSFLPFPGGSQIGGMIGSILGGVIGGKATNATAYAWFTAGPIPQPMPGGVSGKACQSNVCGDEKTSQTASMAAQATVGLMQLVGAAIAQGYRFNSPAFVLTIGARDLSGILHADHSGQWYKTGVGNPGDAAGAAQGAFAWLAQFASPSIAMSVPPPMSVPSVPPPASAAAAPSIGATDPLPGAGDYNSVQAQSNTPVQGTSAPAGASDTTAPAGGGTTLASLLSQPLVLFGGLAALLLLVSEDK